MIGSFRHGVRFTVLPRVGENVEFEVQVELEKRTMSHFEEELDD